MDRPILKGDLNIFLENNFVGSSSADMILPGEDFELTLSVNENIRVKRSLEEMKIYNPGMLSSKRKAKFSFLVTIENYSKENIKIHIVDQIPVSKIEDIEITDLKFSHKPVMKNKKGIVKWTFQMASKKKVQLRMEFYISFPKEKNLQFYKSSLRPNQSLMDLEKKEDKFNQSRSRYREFKPRMQKKMY